MGATQRRGRLPFLSFTVGMAVYPALSPRPGNPLTRELVVRHRADQSGQGPRPVTLEISRLIFRLILNLIPRKRCRRSNPPLNCRQPRRGAAPSLLVPGISRDHGRQLPPAGLLDLGSAKPAAPVAALSPHWRDVAVFHDPKRGLLTNLLTNPTGRPGISRYGADGIKPDMPENPGNKGRHGLYWDGQNRT